MTAKLKQPLLALSLCASLLLPNLASSEDIDIFMGTSAGTAGNPNVIFVLDNTSNWSRNNQHWTQADGSGYTQGQAEVRAIKTALATVGANLNIGVMGFATGSGSGADGGFVRFAVKAMDATNKTALSNTLDTIYSGINSTNEKINSGAAYGDLMYDVYNYLAAGTPTNASKAVAAVTDVAGYTTSALSRFASPLNTTNTCARTIVIFIGNPDSSGPTADKTNVSPTNISGLNALSLAANSPSPITQLNLPTFINQAVTTTETVGTTSACYASSTAAEAGITEFASRCANYSQGCSVGGTADVGTLACPSGSLSYTVRRSVYTPANDGSSSTVTGPVITTANSTGYYAAHTDVPSSDRGGLTCPSDTASTEHDCTLTVTNTAVDSTTAYDLVGTSSACYSSTANNNNNHNWNPTTPTERGTLAACPANATCTYSGVLQAQSDSTCQGQRKKVTITQRVQPRSRFTISRSLTTTTTASGTPTPASTATSDLGKTAACYASVPASTPDFASSCSGTNISCAYVAPTSTSVTACPAGSSAYRIVGSDVVTTNVATTTSSRDTATYNADEWARFMHDDGVPIPGSTTNARQQVTTYTIDVYKNSANAAYTSLYLSMAKAGGGKYFLAQTEEAIVDAIKTILVELQAVNSAFAATSLPVNATNRSQNENQVFIGMFRPDSGAKPRWVGNLKRYQLVINGAAIELADKDGTLALDTNTGFFTPCIKSYWTTDSIDYWSGMGLSPTPRTECTTSNQARTFSDSPDGPQVEKGGAAQVLRQGNAANASVSSRVLNRNMKTFNGTALVDFTAAVSGLDENLVQFIRGADVDGEKGGSTAEAPLTRPSIHGDVIHSRPLPLNYGGGAVTVFYGANDGALRAVDAETGVEKWSFVPPEFYSRLARLRANSPLVAYPGINMDVPPTPTKKDYFYDGSIGVYQNRNSSKVWIYPTMRRGGRMVYALDVTNPASPVYKWRQGCPNYSLSNDTGCTDNMEGIGQTWSTPTVSFIKGYHTDNVPQPVVIMGGGYDTCDDEASAAPACGATKGNKVYIMDAATGALLKTFNTDRAVAGDISLIDIDNDGRSDYAYATDTGGGIYRISFIDGPTSRVALPKETWTINKVAYTSGGGRKFLFAPALVYTSTKIYLAVGSGDREHPLKSDYTYTTPIENRFYVFKDDLLLALPIVAKNLDALDDYTLKTACDPADNIFPTSVKNGWFIKLNKGRGEQTVTSALIAGGLVAFSTNRPLETGASCSTKLGEASGYLLNLFSGSGAIGVDGSCGGSRSSVYVGGGLPPNPVLASGVQIGTGDDAKVVTVMFGTPGKDGVGTPMSLTPEKIRPTVKPNRKKSYSYTKSD